MENGVNPKKSHNGIYVVIAILIILALFGACGKNCDFSSSQSKTCQVCHKTFTNKDDVRSISRTNMCERCYSNYEYTSQLKEAAKKLIENQ